VLARIIDEHPNFNPRAWMKALPKMDAYGALVFQIVGQQLSVRSTRAILGRLEELFEGRLPEPQELLDADPQALRGAGMSGRKVQTLRALAERFASGELSDEFFRRSSDDEIDAALTAIPGIGPWTVHGFLIIALERPDVVLAGDSLSAGRSRMSTASSGCRPSRRCWREPRPGGRIAASRSATCSRRSSTLNRHVRIVIPII
jgi:DNA-3-methyladenine glycosylase II